MREQLTLDIELPTVSRENSTLWCSVESAANSTLHHSVESKIKALTRFCNRKRFKEQSGNVGVYHSGKDKNQYYRYSYYYAGRKKQKHIPGGCVGSPLAEKRAGMIKELINLDRPTSEILILISAFGKGSNGK